MFWESSSSPRSMPWTRRFTNAWDQAARFSRQIHFPANESAVLDHDAARVNIAHESRAVADVDLVGAFDVSLQRTKYVNFLGLDAGAHFSAGAMVRRWPATSMVPSTSPSMVRGSWLSNFACDCNVLAENGLGR